MSIIATTVIFTIIAYAVHYATTPVNTPRNGTASTIWSAHDE